MAITKTTIKTNPIYNSSTNPFNTSSHISSATNDLPCDFITKQSYPTKNSILTPPHPLPRDKKGHKPKKQNGAPTPSEGLTHMLYSFPPCLGHHLLHISSLEEHTTDPWGSSSWTAQDLAKEDKDEPWKPPWRQETPREPDNRSSISGSWISCVVLFSSVSLRLFFCNLNQ